MEAVDVEEEHFGLAKLSIIRHSMIMLGLSLDNILGVPNHVKPIRIKDKNNSISESLTAFARISETLFEVTDWLLGLGSSKGALKINVRTAMSDSRAGV